MSAAKKIDFSKPAVVDFDDITGPEMDDFVKVTGSEFWPFANAIRSGEIAPEDFLSGRNRVAIYALAWIYLKRDQPGLKFEQVYAQGIGTIGVTLEGMRQEYNTRNPANRNVEPPKTIHPWQQES